MKGNTPQRRLVHGRIWADEENWLDELMRTGGFRSELQMVRFGLSVAMAYFEVENTFQWDRMGQLGRPINSRDRSPRRRGK